MFVPVMISFDHFISHLDELKNDGTLSADEYNQYFQNLYKLKKDGTLSADEYNQFFQNLYESGKVDVLFMIKNIVQLYKIKHLTQLNFVCTYQNLLSLCRINFCL